MSKIYWKKIKFYWSYQQNWQYHIVCTLLINSTRSTEYKLLLSFDFQVYKIQTKQWQIVNYLRKINLEPAICLWYGNLIAHELKELAIAPDSSKMWIKFEVIQT